MHFSQIGFTEALTFITFEILSLQHASIAAGGLRIEQLHNPSARLIALGDYHRHLVTRPKPHEVDFRRRPKMRDYAPPVFELHPEFLTGEQFDDRAQDRLPAHGLVRTQGPSAVTATQCSK